MMKSLNYPIISNLCAFVIGVLLVVWPGEAVHYLVVVIGVLFLLPGLMGLLASLAGRQAQQTAFPILALGSTLLGLWLMITPGFFVGILMYVLGVLLVLAGLVQLSHLVSVREFVPVPWGMYVFPVLVFGAGLVVLFNPFEVATVPFVLLGGAAILYSVIDLLRLLRYRRKEVPTVTDVEIIE